MATSSGKVTWLDALPEALRARVAAEAGAEEMLVHAMARASVEQPSLAIDPAELAPYVLSRSRAPEGELGAYLGKVSAGEIALAAACARGDTAAIRAFEETYFDEVPIAYSRFRTATTLDELRQALRDKLFVASEDAEPKIALYAGAGELRPWFRLMVVRMLLNLVTRGPKEMELKDALVDALPDREGDAELAHLRATYGGALAEAFGDAIAKLERRERTLLRYAVCDGLTVDAIGKIYGVHRATAARWVQAARERLEHEVLEAVRSRIPAGTESLVSIMRLLAGEVDVSLRVHLATGPR